MKIGKRIFRLRKSKNLTQTFIANYFGKTPQWLSNIERGTRSISTQELAKMANILEVEPSIFFARNFNKALKEHNYNIVPDKTSAAQ